MVVGEYRPTIEKTLSSVNGIVKDAFIVCQGESIRDKIKTKVKFPIRIIETTPKHYPEPDREISTKFVQQGNWVLILDDDEYLSKPLKQNFRKVLEYAERKGIDIYNVRFKNLVNGVDIHDILGDDFHPRLYRAGAVTWNPQPHRYPELKSPFQIFLDYPIIHDRDLDMIVESHRRRLDILDEEAKHMEFNFLKQLGKRFSRNLVEEVMGLRSYSSI